MSSTPNVRLIYGELMVVYDWLHCILKSKNANTVDITNIATLFHNAEIITFVLDEKDKMGSDEWKAVASSFAKMYELGLSMRIEFYLSRFTPHAADRMYEKAVGYLSDCGRIHVSRQGDRQNMLIFEVLESSSLQDSDSGSFALSQHIGVLIDRLTEGQLAVRRGEYSGTGNSKPGIMSYLMCKDQYIDTSITSKETLNEMHNVFCREILHNLKSASSAQRTLWRK